MCKAITIYGEPWTEERCKKCMPELWTENADSLEAYMALQSQPSYGKYGTADIPLGPRFEAIEAYLNVCGIEGVGIREDILKKLVAVGNAVAEDYRKKLDEQE